MLLYAYTSTGYTKQLVMNAVTASTQTVRGTVIERHGNENAVCIVGGYPLRTHSPLIKLVVTTVWEQAQPATTYDMVIYLVLSASTILDSGSPKLYELNSPNITSHTILVYRN